MMRTYCSMPMRRVMASSFWFRCLVPVFCNRYIKVEFDVWYFQWYVSDTNQTQYSIVEFNWSKKLSDKRKTWVQFLSVCGVQVIFLFYLCLKLCLFKPVAAKVIFLLFFRSTGSKFPYHLIPEERGKTFVNRWDRTPSACFASDQKN